MADSVSFTYSGPFASGAVELPTRAVAFTRGGSVEVTSDEAVLLDRDDDWTRAKQARAPKPTTDAPEGADTQEP